MTGMLLQVHCTYVIEVYYINTKSIFFKNCPLPPWTRSVSQHLYALLRGVRQDHVRAVIADSALLSSIEMYAFLLRPGLAALDNLADKFVAGWLLPSKVLDLSYPTPPLPLLVFAIQSDEGRQLAGRSTASRVYASVA